MVEGDQVFVLDHGHVRFVEAWGSDERVVEAARMSTAKRFLGWGKHSEEDHTDGCSEHCTVGDEKLLKYLWENKHATPFEMAGMVVEVQAPIFVFREWHRHRTQSFSELSARYTPLPDVNYVPTTERLMTNASTSNKQAGTIKGAEMLTKKEAESFRHGIMHHYRTAQIIYEQALAVGVPKELARIHLPVGRYSRMRASANLRNWLAFLTLRAAPAAQWEIRQYAEAVSAMIRTAFPRTHSLWAES